MVSKWDVFPYGGTQGNYRDVVSSFYVSNFPDRIRASDIFKLFACIDEVVEVIIYPRRNKWGRRYGFARFSGMDDIRILGVRLDNVLIDGVKLHANLPRFGRRGFSREEVGEGYAVKSGKTIVANSERCLKAKYKHKEANSGHNK